MKSPYQEKWDKQSLHHLLKSGREIMPTRFKIPPTHEASIKKL